MSCKYIAARTRRKMSDRPAKPYKGFPLQAHPSGNWAKKIRGKFHYFGRWGRFRDGKMEHLPFEASWKAAFELYNTQRDARHAGKTPRVAAWYEADPDYRAKQGDL